MKLRFVLLFCLFGMLGSLAAQGNLQFNQVITLTTAGTVPSGKVWKVESAYYSNDMSFQSAATANLSATFLLNGTTLFLYSRTYRHNGETFAGSSAGRTSDQSVAELTRLPIWLNAGQTIQPGTYVHGFSIIEFNITP